MPARKVLYICPNSRRAGAEQVTALLMRHHDRARWEPQIYFFSDGSLVADLRKEGMVCHLPPEGRPAPRLRKPATLLSEARIIRDLALRERIDLIHSVMGYAHLFGGVAARLARKPEVWFQHGPTGPLDWLTGRVPTRSLIVNSRFTENAQAHYRAWTPRLKRIPLGIEPLSPPDWDGEGQAFRDRAEPGPGAVVFVLAGRISPMKGHLLFVRAAAELLKTDPRVRFWIIGAPFMKGDDAYLDEVRAEIRAHGLEAAFHFSGHLSPPYAAIRGGDVLVNASIEPEPFGLTLVEGMMLGRPVIAPAAGGAAEVIDDGKDGGLCFQPGDPANLAAAMRELLPEARRREIGARGRARALRLFHVERMVREMEAEYDRVIAEF